MASVVFAAESNSSCAAALSGTNSTATVPDTQTQGPVFYRCTPVSNPALTPQA